MEIPLAHTIQSRDGSLTKDSMLVNCIAEPVEGSDYMDVFKRPGTSLQTVLTAGTPQGLMDWKGTAYAVTNDSLQGVFNGLSAALAGAGGAAPAGQMLQSVPTSTTQLLLKGPSTLWTANIVAGVLSTTRVVAVAYPAATVYGIAYLDGVAYVLDTSGNIRGSAAFDPTTWNALNSVLADTAIGTPIGLVRHLNYIVAFGDIGTEFFYDAGNPTPGSALSPIENATQGVGCASALSIAQAEDYVYFISQGSSRGRQVSVLDGLAIRTISTPYIDRIIDNANVSFAYAMKFAGHSLYFLTVVPQFTSYSITLVYDISTQLWSLWSSLSGSPSPVGFPGLTYTMGANSYDSTGQPVHLVMDTALGNRVGSFNLGYYRDLYHGAGTGDLISVFVRTPIYDGLRIRRKRIAALCLKGDTVSTTVSVRYSDDDYTTFSSYRSVTMSFVRKMIRRLGSFYRRSFDLFHQDDTSLRLRCIWIPEEDEEEG